MADREVESSDVEVPEIPEILEKVLLFSLDEAKEKMTQGSDVVPFTALVVKENLFIENHPADSAEDASTWLVIRWSMLAVPRRTRCATTATSKSTMA